jgi:centrin-3
MSKELDIISEVFAQYIYVGEDDEDMGDLTVMKTSDLRDAMVAVGLETTKARVSKLEKRLDRANTGFIEYEKFVEIMTDELQADAHEDGEEVGLKLKEAFYLFTDGQDRSITVDDLKRIATDIKDPATEDQLRDMLSIAGKDQVDMKSFGQIMRSANAL